MYFMAETETVYFLAYMFTGNINEALQSDECSSKEQFPSMSVV